MKVKHLIATVKGVPVWVILEGSGNPEDEHTIKGVIVEQFSFGCDSNIEFDKVDVEMSAVIK